MTSWFAGRHLLTSTLAVEESVFETLRIKRYGRLVVLLTPAMKIISYDFNMLGYDYSIPQPVILHELGALMHQFQQYQQDTLQTKSSDALKPHEVMQIAMTAVANLGHGFEAEVTAALGQACHALLCWQLAHKLPCLHSDGSAHHKHVQPEAVHQKLTFVTS